MPGGIVLETVIGIIIGLVGSLLSAWIGANYSHKRSVELARTMKAEADEETRDAHLRNLQDELSFNREILQQMSTYLGDAPPVIEVLDSVNVASSHLRFKAWDALIRAGVLTRLQPADQRLFRAADRAARQVTSSVQTSTATWRRAIAWQKWNEEEEKRGRLVQGIPLRGLYQQIDRELKQRLDYAVKCVNEALTRLEALLPAEDEGGTS